MSKISASSFDSIRNRLNSVSVSIIQIQNFRDSIIFRNCPDPVCPVAKKIRDCPADL